MRWRWNQLTNMFFCPCRPPVVFGEGCGLGGGLGGFQAFRAPQGTTGHVAAGLGSLWGKAPKSPVIGRLVLRQGLRPLARLIVSTWTLFRLCFPRRRHLLRLDTRRSPPEQKKCRKNRGNRRVQLEDGVVVSVPNGQRPTPDLLSYPGWHWGPTPSGWTRSHRLQTSGHRSKSPSSRPS